MLSAILVPTRGLVSHDLQFGVSTFFVLAGPMPAGVWLQRIYIEIAVSAAVTIDWAGSLGGSGEASLEALNKGLPVVDRALPRVGETPALRWSAPGAARFNFIIPVGVRIAEGSTWFVWGWENSSGANVSIHVGLELVELIPQRDAK